MNSPASERNSSDSSLLHPMLPALALPYPVISNILKSLSPIDFISFSLASARSNKLAQSVRFPRKVFTKVEVAESSVSIIFQNGAECEDDFIWRFTEEKAKTIKKITDSKNLLSPSIFQRCITAHYVFDMLMTSESHVLYSKNSTEMFEKTVEAAINHTRCLFCSEEIHTVSVDTDLYPKFGSNFVWSVLKKCRNVHFTGQKISNKELDTFFKNFKLEKRFDLEADNSCKTLLENFHMLSNLSRLEIKNASWLQNDHLHQIRCSRVFLQKTKVTGLGVNEWLKNWMNDTDSREGMMTIEAQKRFSVEQILSGLEYEQITFGGELVSRSDGRFLRIELKNNNRQLYIVFLM